MTDYWERKDLAETIQAALVAAGKNLDALSVDDLAITDQFHGGGKPSTLRLARLLAPTPGTRVLDVGGGLGGPARTLAVEFGCRVTVVDLTTSFVRAGQMLTDRVGLGDRVTHRVGNALELPFEPGAFDVVWTQNSAWASRTRTISTAASIACCVRADASRCRSRCQAPCSHLSTR